MPDLNEHFEHESLQDSESIIKYVDAIKEGFQKGRLCFSAKNKQLVLKPQGLLNLNVKVKKKDKKAKLYIKLSWIEDQEEKETATGPLVIKGE